MTHFDIFELPRSVDLESSALEKKFHALSLEWHPDRQPASDASARRIAAEKTASLNEAYKVLKDPARRAFYVLKLLGIDLSREDSPIQKQLPLHFLEEVLEQREALDAAKKARDLKRVQAMAEEVRAARTAALTAGTEALRQALGHEEDPAAVGTATKEMARLKYFDRFLEEVESIEEQVLAS